MTFANQVGVAQVRICVGDAQPRRAMTKLRFRDDPERVAATNGVFCGSWRRGDRRRHDDLRTYLKDIRIAEPGVESEQFLPATSVTDVGGSELPERVAGLDGDHSQLARNFR